MQNYDLHGVRNAHWDYKHRESLHDLPDMEGFMKDKVKDIIWDLERVEAEDRTEDRLDSAIGSVNDLVKDVPHELEAFATQYNAKESMIADMTYSALAVTRSIDNIRDLISTSGVDNPFMNRLKDMLEEARAECDDIFCTQSQRLHSLLTNFGWSDSDRCYVKKLLGYDFDPILTVDPSASSSPSDMAMSYNETLLFDGGPELDLFMHDYAISVSVKGWISVKHDSQTTMHHFRDLMSHFDDFLNPTQSELAVYLMATEKEWDILKWYNLLKLKLK